MDSIRADIWFKHNRTPFLQNELYMADGQRERALAIYLQLQRPGLFDFIHQHKLYGAVHDKVGKNPKT